MSEWRRLTLEEADVILIDCVHKTPKAQEVGLPYIGIPQLKSGHIDFNANPRLITEEDLIEWTKKANPKFNDVILSRRTNPGVTAHVPENKRFALGQNLVIIRSISETVYPPYLRWLLMGPDWWSQISKFLNVGAIFDSLRCGDIPKFELNIPPVEEQTQISKILNDLDDKIELNRQMNQTLEAMAQALFKSWFVDFDPVLDNTIAAGHEIPEALQAKAVKRQLVSDNLKLRTKNPELAAQFPSSFVFNERLDKWIPGGWEMKSLDEIAHYQNGLALQKFRPDNEDDDFLPVLKISHLKDGKTDGKERARTDIKPSCRVEDGDVIFSWSASLLVDIWCGGKAALNQHLFKVTSDKFPKWFYYMYTKHHLDQFIRIAADKAVTMGHIKREHLSEAKCAFMNQEGMDKISPHFENIVNKQIENRLETETLTQLRDTLLPQLISGKVRAEGLLRKTL